VISRRSFFAAALLPAACGRKHSTGFDGYAYVANEEGQAIAVVDLTAFAVLGHVHLSSRPTAVITHPRTPSVYALTPATGIVHEINGGRLTVVRRLQAGSSAVTMRMPAGDPTKLYVLYREPRKIACFSLERAHLEWQLSLPADAVDFDLSDDGRIAVISFGSNESLGFVDTETRTLKVVPAGTELGFVRFRSDANAVLVADVRGNMLLIYDVPLRRLVVRLPLAVRPEQICSGVGGGQSFITGEGLDAVVVVYPYQTQVSETVLAGRKPGAMAASDGSPPYLFIANPGSGDVTIMNLLTRKVAAIASVGAEPGYIGITPDNQYALVLNRKSGDMGVLWIRDKLASRQKSAGLLTMIPVGSKPVSAAIRQA
jgi:DNA-binding beta-propeller fold protein YncE